MRPIPILTALVVAIVTAACIPDTGPAAGLCTPDSVEIDLTVSAQSLSPNDPAVCRGQEVTFVVTSDEAAVLHVHGYDEAVPATQLSADETTTITFTADRSGQFPIELHPEDDPRGVEAGVLTVHEP